MNWFQSLLAAAGLFWWLFKCVVCGLEMYVRKNTWPAGWFKGSKGWVCPLCSDFRIDEKGTSSI